MSTLGERIYLARKNRGMTLEEIASAVGVHKSTIQRYEKDEYANPKLPVIESIARALNVNPVWLVGQSDDMTPGAPAPASPALTADALAVAARYDAAAPALKKAVLSILDLQPSVPEPEPVKLARVVPLLGQRFAAGVAEAPGDLFMEDYETEDPRAEFAIHVNGDSMAPYLPDGSIALGVKRIPEDGEVGAFWLDGGFLVKQFCSDSEGNVYLFSLNRARSDADVTIRSGSDRDLRCVGTILMKRLPLPDK